MGDLIELVILTLFTCTIGFYTLYFVSLFVAFVISFVCDSVHDWIEKRGGNSK